MESQNVWEQGLIALPIEWLVVFWCDANYTYRSIDEPKGQITFR
jgi:hypothetical protein